jgi:putative ABC transport system permease protein
MTSWESLVLTLVAVAIGTATSLTTLGAFGAAMTGSAPYVPPLPYLGVIASAAALVLLTSRLSTRAAMRRPPAEAIGAGE